jgi:serine O-acetyltransferase
MKHRILNCLIPYYCALAKKGKIKRTISRFLKLFVDMICSVDIHIDCIFPKSTWIPHYIGIVIGETAILGEKIVIMPNVVLGRKSVLGNQGKRHPTIGNGVFIGAGAVILGDIEVGDNSVIGANATLTSSVPPNSLVTGYNCIREKK